jgi:F0F1-type ATP synthase assembly protein I
MKKHQADKQLVLDLKKDTQKIEKAHRKKQSNRKKAKKAQEDLSQQWLAPLLLMITLIIGYLLYLFY